MRSTMIKSCLLVSILSPVAFGVESVAVGTEMAPPASMKEPAVMKEMIVLSVSKSQLRAELKTLPENGEEPKPIRSFKIAVGKMDGDKEKEGDNKTPEGIYFTVGKIDGKQLTPEKYGPVALPLNFPNPMDQLQGKTGHGIWLHGVGGRRIEDAKVTEGCIAFPNSEITSLVSWLKPSHGVVVIANDLTEVNRAVDLSDLFRASQDWMAAWASRDLEKYISYYSDDFENAGKKLTAYKTYKQAVFKRYKEMSVRMDNVRIVTHPKYALVMMNQDFNGDGHFKSDGRKMLFWRRDSQGKWRIVREMFDNFLMNPVQFSTEDVAGMRQEGSLKLPNNPAASAATPHTRSL